MSRYEHLIMRSIDFLATRDWIYRYDPVRRFVEKTADLIMSTINGEVLTAGEAKEMIDSIIKGGYTVAVGTCPCRRARNELSDEVPNNTDMVFGRWAEGYIENYPGLYREVTREEARELIDEFDRLGFLHQVYGFLKKEGVAFVVCNCDQEVCIPLNAQKLRGFQSFRKGRALASVDREACLGLEECGVCVSRCPFDARLSGGPSGAVDTDKCFGCGVCVVSCKGNATSLERKKDAQLAYARKLVL
jgi:ferredoxin